MSIQVVKIKNIPIKLHFTLIIVFFLIAWTVTANFMPLIFPGLEVYHYWIMGISGAAVLFVSVAVHELAHSIVSLRYGVKVRQIILFIFGGVSDIKEEPKDYSKEFKIAIVGPLASFIIAGLFAGASWGLFQLGGEAAAPMFTQLDMREDGDVTSLGDVQQQPAAADTLQFTSPETITIRILSGIMVYGAFINILTGSFVGGFWLILIGWFLQSGAQAYLQQYELSNSLSRVRLREIMRTTYTSVSPNTSVKELLTDYFNVYRKSEFPVIDSEKGILLGSVTAKQAMNVSQDVFSSIKVRDIMTPVTELVKMNQDDHAYEALTKMYKANKSRVYVCSDEYPKRYSKGSRDIEEGGKIVGIISKTDILNVASENQEYMHNLAKAAVKK